MRIYKGTKTTLNLFFPACAIDAYQELSVVLYTTNPDKSIKLKNVKVEGNTLFVEVKEYDFTILEDGVIKYLVLGDDISIATERQSNYFLKTPSNYNATEISAEPYRELVVIENGEYTITPNKGYMGIEEVKVIVDLPIEEIQLENYNKGYSEGYAEGESDGYNGGYSEGMSEGYAEGVEDQKEKLDSISITTNGTYEREDGYNHIIVEVPDLNGSYDEGYSDGYLVGEDEGYSKGVDEARDIVGEEIAQTARVLDITENGYYLSKYSDPIIIYPELVTGDFGDGTYFYDWAEVKDGCFDTKVIPTANSRIEFWFKPAETSKGLHFQNIFGCGYVDGNENTFDLKYYSTNRDKLELRIGNKHNTFTFNNQIWNHFIIDNGTLWLNGEELFTLDLSTYVSDGSSILINSVQGRPEYFANGLFGMFKIDGHIFIPSETGFINYNTGEELGGYNKQDNNVIYAYNENDTSNITGYFDDGTEFKNYALITGAYFNTAIPANPNSRLEFWYRNNKFDKSYCTIVGAQDGNKFIFKVCEKKQTQMGIEYGSTGGHNQEFSFPYDNNWHHFIMSKADGLVLDGVKQFDLTGSFKYDLNPTFYINCSGMEENTYNANGEIGMVKIDGHIFIPTQKGFLNYETNKLLSSNWVFAGEKPVFTGEYSYTENEIIEYKTEGNLIKTINVNVPPKLPNIGIKLGYSSFTKVPDDLVDWKNLTDANSMFRECTKLTDLGDIYTSNIKNMDYCFYNCSSLSDFKNIDISNATTLNNTFNGTKINDETIAKLNTSNVTNMSYAFANCSEIKVFPSIDTSNVTTFARIFESSMELEEVMPIDTSKATDLSYMFYNFSAEHKLRKLSEFDCTNVTNMNSMFSYYQDRMDYFTDCGGWKNLKINWNDNYGLRCCANLSYESCINILNGLWDFRGNGDSTTTRTLKVHQNFLDLVGDEVSIAALKGWNVVV